MQPILPAYDPTFILPTGWRWTLLLLWDAAGDELYCYRVAHPADQPLVAGFQAALVAWSQVVPEQVALLRLVHGGQLTWGAILEYLPDAMLRDCGLILVDRPAALLLTAAESVDDLLTAA